MPILEKILRKYPNLSDYIAKLIIYSGYDNPIIVAEIISSILEEYDIRYIDIDNNRFIMKNMKNIGSVTITAIFPKDYPMSAPTVTFNDSLIKFNDNNNNNNDNSKYFVMSQDGLIGLSSIICDIIDTLGENSDPIKISNKYSIKATDGMITQMNVITKTIRPIIRL